MNLSLDQAVIDGLAKGFKEWRRWTFVEDKSEADVIIAFADKNTTFGTSGAFVGSSANSPYSDQRFLILIDPSTNENRLVISCERRLSAGYTANVLINRLKKRISEDEKARSAKPRG